MAKVQLLPKVATHPNVYALAMAREQGKLRACAATHDRRLDNPGTSAGRGCNDADPFGSGLSSSRIVSH
jgi:hypothetical protein